jgi:hypothetical protein
VRWVDCDLLLPASIFHCLEASIGLVGLVGLFHSISPALQCNWEWVSMGACSGLRRYARHGHGGGLDSVVFLFPFALWLRNA